MRQVALAHLPKYSCRVPVSNTGMTPLRDRVRQAEEAGFTQAAMARACKISSSAVAQWKSGDSYALRAPNAVALAKLTGWSASWWATGTGPREANDAPQGAWPFAMVDQARFESLGERAKGFVEAALSRAIDDAERAEKSAGLGELSTPERKPAPAAAKTA